MKRSKAREFIASRVFYLLISPSLGRALFARLTSRSRMRDSLEEVRRLDLGRSRWRTTACYFSMSFLSTGGTSWRDFGSLWRMGRYALPGQPPLLHIRLG